VLPEWFLAAMVVDQGRRSGNGHALTIAQATEWMEDLIGGRVVTSRAGAFALPALGAGVLPGYPTDVLYYQFHEGGFVYVPQSSVDWSLLRDSTLAATNDMQFVKRSFELVLPLSQAPVYKGTIATTVDGSTGALKALAAPGV